MNVEHVEVLVEEPSMEVVLRVLLPQLLRPEVTFEVYPSTCKQALLAHLPERLRGYRPWLPDTWRIVVIVDRDDEDCGVLKNKLETLAAEAGLLTKTAASDTPWRVVNRLAIEELEAWFFGDMDAVRAAYPGIGKTIEKKAPYRNPDAIRGGTWEALERVLKKGGHFKGGLRKVEAARAISEHMKPDRNRSHSFQVFRDTVREL